MGSIGMITNLLVCSKRMRKRKGWETKPILPAEGQRMSLKEGVEVALGLEGFQSSQMDGEATSLDASITRPLLRLNPLL